MTKDGIFSLLLYGERRSNVLKCITHKQSHFLWLIKCFVSLRSRFLCRRGCLMVLICEGVGIGGLRQGQRLSTPFAVHYEKIRNHLRETAINYAKRHSLARKYEHLRKSQIQ